MAGRRAAAVETAERTPWQVRERAARELGRVRRAIADGAMAGELPAEALRAEYRAAEAALDDAQADWLASRAGAVRA
jgi:hypothetical protein